MTAPLLFLDTHVLLYGIDDLDPVKRDRAQGWLAACWRRQCGRVSTQVMNEFYWNARRKFSSRLTTEEARMIVRRYQNWNPWQLDQNTVETAWEAESRWQLSYWDSLMVAAAQQQGCTVLLTENLQHDQRFDGLRVVNPFVLGPELMDPPSP